MDRGNIKPLTSLRFLAAFLVFLHHGHPTLDKHVQIAAGAIGVGFFFMLSGLILAYVYDKRLAEEGRHRFYLARVARIMPLHLVTAVLAMMLFPPEVGLKAAAQIVFNLPLLQSFVPHPAIYFSLNAPSWSLSNEMFFYLAFPFVIPALQKLSRPMAGGALAALFIAIVLWGLAWSDNGSAHWAIYIFPLARFMEFLAGILAWQLLKEIRIGALVATLLEVAALVGIVGLILNYDLFPLWAQYVSAFFVPCLVLLGVFYLSSGSVSAFLSSRPFVYLGEISFAFYMVHVLVLRSLPEIGIYGALIITLISAVVAHHGVEVPMQRLLQRRALLALAK